ncbi:MAG TPA: LysM peptidoglycan-binding domain-containing M23 family metallopeptidase [Anaerolineaceae bacterium]|nr:LysM peptidoglycan-binding domain-containing M23 family metallopeptidase [Anaerolineaceae bacterium]
MTLARRKTYAWLWAALTVMLMVSACSSPRPTYIIPEAQQTETPVLPTSTPFPTRPVYPPGTLVDYIAQSGDTLPLLAVRFNTTIEEIRQANPEIPESATTMPPGFPMKIPIYYRDLWGTSYQIIPDSAFVYGPDLIGFDLRAFLDSTTGWFKNYRYYLQNVNQDAAGLLTLIAENYSVNPRLLLALLEYRAQALTNPERDPSLEVNILIPDRIYTGIYRQLSYTADLLNDGYYSYRQGEIISIEHLNGEIENIDPWQNAGTAAVQIYFASFLDGEEYLRAIGPDGLAKTYRELFGDPWAGNTTVLPGSLVQPVFILPFRVGETWAYTGGPHGAWGNLRPWAALDFAPPMHVSGCAGTNAFALAVADGVIARVGDGIVILDLDGDGDERTGWVVFYLHIAAKDRIAVGTVVQQGDPIGRPSCEGGTATGTHVHIARKYNGEWISAVGVIPFNLEGWTPIEGSAAYQGKLVRGSEEVIASTRSASFSMITRK